MNYMEIMEDQTLYKHVPNPNADPEKSKTNELKVNYLINDLINIENTFYRSSIQDALLYNSSYNGGSGYTNNNTDLKQDGIESVITFMNKDHRLKYITQYRQVSRLMVLIN